MPLNQKNAQFWDRSARQYAADPIKDMAGYERTVERTRQWLKASDRVLEIGCGTGTTALKLAPSVSHLLGTDISAAMIAIAQEKARGQSCANADFMALPAEEAAARPGLYDAVLAFNLLHLVEDRETTLWGIRRALRPGGLFISKTPCLTELNPVIRLAVPAMRLIGKAPFVSFFSAAALEADVIGAGFTILEQARHGTERKDLRLFLVAQAPT